MAKTIAFTNQKGGVGKTTSAINIASALGILGKKTLLIDSDPQGNASSGVGVRKSQLSHTTYDVLIGRCPARDAVIHTEFKNLDVMPATMSLAGAEFELADIEKRERRLSAALDEIKADYDFIIIDCPPSLGLLTINALTAADTLLAPIQCEYYALEGLSDLMNTVKLVRTHLNSKLAVEGVVLTMFDARTNLSEQVVLEVKKFFKNKVYDTIIPRSVRLGEAPSFGMPINKYDPKSVGAKAYDALARELVEKEK